MAETITTDEYLRIHDKYKSQKSNLDKANQEYEKALSDYIKKCIREERLGERNHVPLEEDEHILSLAKNHKEKAAKIKAKIEKLMPQKLEYEEQEALEWNKKVIAKALETQARAESEKSSTASKEAAFQKRSSSSDSSNGTSKNTSTRPISNFKNASVKDDSTNHTWYLLTVDAQKRKGFTCIHLLHHTNNLNAAKNAMMASFGITPKDISTDTFGSNPPSWARGSNPPPSFDGRNCH